MSLKKCLTTHTRPLTHKSFFMSFLNIYLLKSLSIPWSFYCDMTWDCVNSQQHLKTDQRFQISALPHCTNTLLIKTVFSKPAFEYLSAIIFLLVLSSHHHQKSRINLTGVSCDGNLRHKLGIMCKSSAVNFTAQEISGLSPSTQKPTSVCVARMLACSFPSAEGSYNYTLETELTA